MSYFTRQRLTTPPLPATSARKVQAPPRAAAVDTPGSKADGDDDPCGVSEGAPGDADFDFSVLSGSCARLVEHGPEELALDTLLQRLGELELVGPDGNQRSDATRVVSMVRARNVPELAGDRCMLRWRPGR